MEILLTVRDVSGTYRTFTVPAALKLGKMKDGALVRQNTGVKQNDLSNFRKVSRA